MASQSPYPPAGYQQPEAPQATYAPPSMPHPAQYGGNAPATNGYTNGNGGAANGYYAGAPEPAYNNQYNAPLGGKTQESQYYQQSQAAGGQGYNAPPPKGEVIEGKFDDVKPKCVLFRTACSRTVHSDTLTRRWNDLIFALIFLAQLGAFIAIAVISLRALPASESTGGLGSIGSATTINASIGWLLAITAGLGLLLSLGLLALVRFFTKIILEICLVLSLITTIGYAVYMWIQKYWSGAIIWTIFAVFAILAYPGMRRRIPLSKQLLIYVIRVAKVHPSVYIIAIIGATLVTAYSAFWGIAVAGIYQKWEPNAAGSGTSGGTPSYGAVTGLMVFAVFNLYYTTQFIT